MDCTSTRLPYRQTGTFSKIVLDYIDQAGSLKSFYNYPATLQGIQKAIAERKKFKTDRTTLVKELQKQYAGITVSSSVQKNIDSLLSENTFTVTTAHQNNLFSGPLYFIYKIIHAIKLADHLNSSMPDNHFVPVFYIGTEDADIDELNHIYLGGEKLVWNTRQKGAVGRMKIDKEVLKLVDRMEGQLSVQPFGKEIISIVKASYKNGEDLQTATFRFVNTLFAEYGLIVLLPDKSELKKQMIPVFEDDLLKQTASSIVEKTAQQLQDAGYKIQANPREINLFYLKEDIRERIERKNDQYSILNTQFSFNEAELLAELKKFPENFSPNVILRGLYQETILPNIAFIGGGGELAYWLQLKELFENYKVPFPVLVLRNSFLVIEKKWQAMVNKLGFTTEDFFLTEQELLNKLVARESSNPTQLNGSLTKVEQLYESFKKQAEAVDSTLAKHVNALKSQTVHRLQELEKKMLRAEKRKFTDQQHQIHSVKEHLFPGNGLQERRDNISYYYAKWGKDIIQKLYEHSGSLEQEFVILSE